MFPLFSEVAGGVSTARVERDLVHLVYLVYLVCLVDRTGHSSSRTRQTRKTSRRDRQARAQGASKRDRPGYALDTRVLAEQSLEKLIAGYIEMRSDIGQDGRERSNAKWCMVRNRDVMLAVLLRCHAKMAAGLASDVIAEFVKGLGKIASREIAGQPHTAMTSSRTWCRRTTRGAIPSWK